MSLSDTLRRWWGQLAAEAAKFGVIGAIGVFVDLGAYAFLQYGWFGPTEGPLYGHEKLASVGATAIASVFSWVCNRYWTFRHKRGGNLRREIVLFSFFNAIGALITVGCIAFAIDVLHLRGLAWESAARIVGIGVGTLFRFWTYRRWVFVAELAPQQPARATSAPDRTTN